MGRIFTDDSPKNRRLRVVYNRIQRAVKPFVNYTIFQNRDDAEYFYRYSLASKDNSSIVKSSGIDMDSFSREIDISKIRELVEELDIDLSRRTVIMVSRMVQQKGVMEYLEASRACHTEGFCTLSYLWGQLDRRINFNSTQGRI